MKTVYFLRNCYIRFYELTKCSSEAVLEPWSKPSTRLLAPILQNQKWNEDSLRKLYQGPHGCPIILIVAQVVKKPGVLSKDDPHTSQRPDVPPNVAVFIHGKLHLYSHSLALSLTAPGFPDSYLLWRNVLQASSLDSQVLIAVDLPGYGGSEGLKNYGPNDMLESMTEFILAMREMYLRDEAKIVVVSHDWGSVIAARLASEASQLADRWVITSIAIVSPVAF